MTRNPDWRASATVLLLTGLLWAGAASSHGYGHNNHPTWSVAVPVAEVNTGSAEGCPIESPDGLSLLFASNRDSGSGFLDIWTADRPDTSASWSEPRNLPQPVNSTAADFCPLPVGRTLLFVSEREGPDTCGGGDIYMSRQSPAGGWSEPVNLGCAPNGPNFSGPERSPSLVETWYGTWLLYSSTGTGGDHDIYASRLHANGSFGPGRVVRQLSTDANDLMPNVRVKEDGNFEIVFSSDVATWGRHGEAAYGGQDVYSAESRFLPYLWSRPENLGPNVNTGADEQRATLSRDGNRMYFGRTMDIYMSERRKSH